MPDKTSFKNKNRILKVMNKISYCFRLFTPTGLIILLSVGAVNAGSMGGKAGAFLRMGLGADRVAMGDCGVALVSGEMDWYYNPASIPFQSGKQAALGYRWLSLDRSMIYADFSMPLEPQPGLTLEPNAGISFGVMRAGTSEIDIRDENGVHYYMMSHSENLIHGTFALRPHKRFAVGLTIKWMINAVPDATWDDKNLYAYGMGIDLGMRFVATRNLRFGLQLRDLNAKYSWETSEVLAVSQGVKDDRFPNIVRIGSAWDPLKYLTVAMDLNIHSDDLGNDSEAIEPHIGGEYRYDLGSDKNFAMRAGWDGDVPTFGFGLSFDLQRTKARMDYAYILEEIAPSGSHIIGWILEF